MPWSTPEPQLWCSAESREEFPNRTCCWAPPQSMLFDLGVYLTVVGATLLILANLGKLPQSRVVGGDF